MATREELEYLVRVNDRDLKELQRNVKSTNQALDKDLGNASTKADSSLRKVNRGALIAAGAIGGGLLLAAKNAWEELSNSQKVGAQTDAVLKSTAGSAGVTKKQIDDLAGSISNYSGIDDEVVQSGENMLLTFTNIRNEAGKGNDIFNQSTSILADMSTAMGTDMNKSAIQLGKALNDPVKGITALTRVGVTFDEATKKQIKTLVAHGHTVAAQKIILHELNKEFGGSAKAAGDTLPGQLNKARNAFDNMSAELLTALLPALTGLVGWVAKGTQFLTEHEHATKIAIVAIAALAAGVFAVNAAVKVYQAGVKIAAALQWAWNAAMEANPIGLVVLALVGLGIALIAAYKKSETFRQIVQSGLHAVEVAADAVKSKAEAIWHGFSTTVEWVRAHWPIIATLIAGPFAPIVALATNAFGIRSAFSGALDAVKTYTSNKVGDIAGFFSALPGRIADAIAGAMGDLKKRLGQIFDWHKVVRWIKDALDFHSPAPWAVGIGEDIVGSIAHGVGGAAGVLKDAVIALAKKFVSGGGLFGVSGLDLLRGGAHAGANLGPLPGEHSPGSAERYLVPWAEAEGMTITAIANGRHVAGSYHYQHRAVDAAGSPSAMARYFGDTANHFGIGNITELFYDPIGYYIKNGHVIRGAIGGHSDHVHVALDSGGLLMPGATMALNLTGRPERVLSPTQNDLFERMVSALEGGAGGGPLVHIDHAEFGSELDAELVASALSRTLAFRR